MFGHFSGGKSGASFENVMAIAKSIGEYSSETHVSEEDMRKMFVKADTAS